MKKLWSIVLILALVVAPCVVAHVPGSGQAARAAVLSGAPHDDTGTGGTPTNARDPHTRFAEVTLAKAPDGRDWDIIAPDQTALAGLVHNHFDNNQGDGDDHDCEQNCNGWMSAGNSGAVARLSQQSAGADPIILPPVNTAIVDLRPDRVGERVALQAYTWPARQSEFDQLSVLERTGRLRI